MNYYKMEELGKSINLFENCEILNKGMSNQI